MSLPVQYVVVRADLAGRYGIGVLATQVAHAAVAPLTAQLRSHFDAVVREALDSDSGKWVSGSFRKIVLEVPSQGELLSLMDRLRSDGVHFVEIREATLGNELTCIGLRPRNKGSVAPYFKGLKLLGHRAHRLHVNGSDWPLAAAGFDARAIRSGESDPAGRFVLEARLSACAFPHRIDTIEREGREVISESVSAVEMSSGESMTATFVHQARRNEPRFVRAVLVRHFELILGELLGRSTSRTVTLTSLDSMCVVGNTMLIVGGCRIVEETTEQT